MSEPKPFPDVLLSKERVVCTHLVTSANFSQRQDHSQKKNSVRDASAQSLCLVSWAGK